MTDLHEHKIIECNNCGTILLQCRCYVPDELKEIEYVICQSCQADPDYDNVGTEGRL